MFTGRITPAFVFHCANQNGVKKSVRAYRGFARGLELGVTGGFTAIGYENDDVATLALLRGKATGTENDGVIDGCTCAGRNLANGILEHGDFVGEVGNARDVLVEAKDGQVIAGANDLLDEMSGGGVRRFDAFGTRQIADGAKRLRLAKHVPFGSIYSGGGVHSSSAGENDANGGNGESF